MALRRRASLPSLLAAQVISTAGTRMSQTALPWLVLERTGDTFLTGAVTAAEIAPYVVLQILGAPLVDRFGGRRIAMGGNLVAAAAMGAVWVLATSGAFSVLAVLALVFVAGLARGPADAATQVLLPPVAEMSKTTIDRAAGLVDGSSRVAQVVGALGGGALIAVIGAASVVLIDGVSFITAFLLIAVIAASAGRTREPRAVETDSYRGALREGLGYVRRNGLIRAVTGTFWFMNLADAAMTGLLLLLWADRGTAGTTGLGFVSAAFAGGAVVGALMQAAFGTAGRRRKTFTWSLLICGAPRYVALALPLPLPLVIVIWAVSGVGEGAINPIVSAAQYEVIPRRLQARVIAATRAIAYAGIPIGPLVGAGLVGTLGFSATLWVLAVSYAVVSLSPFFVRGWKLLDPVPAER